MNPPRTHSPFTNRIVIGALVVLVLIIAVVLAYQSGAGLPFVPAYRVNADVPDAAGLLKGDGVLIGGDRVGYVGAITAARLPDGRDIAVLHLKLNTSIGHLPIDSSDLVRPVSPLGLKYLQITRGHASRLIPPGGTIPVSHTSTPVEIDDLYDMFTPRTRSAEQVDVFNVGTGFAGRGAALNAALAGLHPLVDDVLPAMDTLLAPRTRLAALFPSLQQAAAEVAPVAVQQAHLFTALDETFTPLSAHPGALRAAIAGGPPALRTATSQFPAQARFIDDTTSLLAALHPTFSALGQASQNLSAAETAGIPALRTTPALNGRLDTTVGALGRFAADPRTLPGLSILGQTARLIEPTIAYIEPAQTDCNYLALFFANLENALSESDSVGSMLRVEAILLPQVPGSEAGPAASPADGPSTRTLVNRYHLNSIQKSLVQDSYLHSDPDPATAAPGQGGVCEAGNERYVPGRTVIGAAPVPHNYVVKTKRVLP